MFKGLRVIAFISATMSLTLAAAADDMTTTDIIDGLKPKSLTRSLGGGGAGLAEPQRQKLESLLSRSIGVIERQQISAIVEEAKLPRLDFAIYFAFDSAEISGESMPTLDRLGAALASAELRKMIFLVNGHTDAKGPDDYNQDLSERRAMAVANYLAEHFPIGPEKLKAIGFGEARLKDPADPDAAVNRRVEIVNLTYGE